MIPYIFNPDASFTHYSFDTVDAGFWRTKYGTLVVVTNLADQRVRVTFPQENIDRITWLLQDDVQVSYATYTFEPLSSGILVFSQTFDSHLYDEL